MSKTISKMAPKAFWHHFFVHFFDFLSLYDNNLIEESIQDDRIEPQFSDADKHHLQNIRTSYLYLCPILSERLFSVYICYSVYQ